MRYLEFACASNFSFLRGASHPEELMAQAAKLGLAGLGLCDRNSVAGVVRAHLAKREQNLPLRYHPGARLVFADGTPDILAYPRDRAGWGRLTRLLTVGNLPRREGRLYSASRRSAGACFRTGIGGDGRQCAAYSRACALPPPAACGSPPRCSTADAIARGSRAAWRWRAKPMCR